MRFNICQAREEGLCVSFLGCFGTFAQSSQIASNCAIPVDVQRGRCSVSCMHDTRRSKAVTKSVLVTELGHGTETNRDHSVLWPWTLLLWMKRGVAGVQHPLVAALFSISANVRDICHFICLHPYRAQKCAEGRQVHSKSFQFKKKSLNH